ncbi:vWA domain-containing protein [Actinoplanes sp. NPDC026619]|uniref:vWA domain-containing protein n=1 Tax=Actinoplanes sp. NPDC026619 TaxID=3155798 RepID=UPI0033D51111
MRRLGRLVAVAMIFAGLVFGGGPAVAAPGTPTLDDVLALVGNDVDRATADVVVMIDVSASMDDISYARVKESLAGYLKTLAPVDQVTLVAYARNATVTATQRVGTNPGRMIDSLPPAPLGGPADLGTAVDATISTLRRPTAPGLATVLLITAGPDATNAAQGAEWKALAKQARAVWQRVDAWAIPLAEVTSAPLLTKVWSAATVVPETTIDDLPAMLGQVRDSARRIKARNLLAGDLVKPIRVNWPEYGGVPHGRSVTEVEVKSPLKYVPVTLDKFRITSTNPRVRVSVPRGPIELRPGQAIKVPITAHWDAGPRRKWPFFTVDGRTELKMSARVTTSWSPVLNNELDLTLTSTLAGEPKKTALSAQRGSFWYWLSALVLIAVLAEILVWWWRHPPEKRRKRTVTVAGTSFTWEEKEVRDASMTPS